MYIYMYIYIYIYKPYIYAIKKTVCPRGYHNSSVANHALRHMMYGCNIVHHVPKCMSCQKAILLITGIEFGEFFPQNWNLPSSLQK